MEYVDNALLVLLLKYATFSIASGASLIVVFELLVFGVMKAFSILRKW